MVFHRLTPNKKSRQLSISFEGVIIEISSINRGGEAAIKEKPLDNYSKMTHFLFKLVHPSMVTVMESLLQRRLNDAVKTLKAAGNRSGQSLEGFEGSRTFWCG